MNDCPFKPYCNDDCDNCTDTDKSEKINRVSEAMQHIITNIVEVITPAIQEATKAITGLWQSVIKCYPDRHVVHLALHHRKKKVRKKNTNRIMRWLKAEEKVKSSIDF